MAASRQGARGILRWVETQRDAADNVGAMTHEWKDKFDKEYDERVFMIDYERMNEDMYLTLMRCTTGEARGRVKQCGEPS